MDTGEGIRLQVFAAILTGVLVIVITTAVVIMMGRKSTVDNFDHASNPLPSLAFPTPYPSPTPVTPASSPTSKKPTKSAAPTTLRISCDSATVTKGTSINCKITINPAPSSTIMVALEASTGDVSLLPTTAYVMAGTKDSDPVAVTGESISAGPTTLTAKAIGLTAIFEVAVI